VLKREVLKVLESLRLLLSACSLVLLVMSIYLWRWPEPCASQPPARYLRWFATWLAVTAVLYLLLWLTVNLVPESNARGYVSQSIFFVSLTALLLTTAGNLYRNLSRRALSDEGKPKRPDNARTAVGAWVTITSLLLAGYIHFLWLSVGHGLFVALPLALTIFGAAVGVWFMMPYPKARS
jgi:hypothetical protein